MDDPIGRVVAFGRGRAERRPRQHPRRLRVPDPKLLGSDHEGLQPGARPRASRTREALGESCRPAPASSRRCTWSNTATANPRCASASAAVRPPMPAPAMMTLREDVTIDVSFAGTRLVLVFSEWNRCSAKFGLLPRGGEGGRRCLASCVRQLLPPPPPPPRKGEGSTPLVWRRLGGHPIRNR